MILLKGAYPRQQSSNLLITVTMSLFEDILENSGCNTVISVGYMSVALFYCFKSVVNPKLESGYFFLSKIYHFGGGNGRRVN